MLSSISEDAKEDGCKQSFARARSVDKYQGKGVFKANKGGKYEVKGQTNFVTFFRDKN